MITLFLWSVKFVIYVNNQYDVKYAVNIYSKYSDTYNFWFAGPPVKKYAASRWTKP